MTPRERLDRLDEILQRKIARIEDEARRRIDRITDQRVRLRVAWLRAEVAEGKGREATARLLRRSRRRA